MAVILPNVGTLGSGSQPGWLIPAGWVDPFGPLDNRGPTARKRVALITSRKGQFATCAAPKTTDMAKRVVHWITDMAEQKLPAETVYKTVREIKDFCFDFTNEPSVKSGGTLTNPRITFEQTTGLPTQPVAAAPNVTVFIDSDGKRTEIGKGIIARFAGGTTQILDVRCVVTILQTNEDVECPMRLIITK